MSVSIVGPVCDDQPNSQLAPIARIAETTNSTGRLTFSPQVVLNSSERRIAS